MPKKQAMTKTELKGLLVERLRDPALPISGFIALTKRYSELSQKRNAKSLSRPADDEVNAIVERARRSQQRANLRAQACNELKQAHPAKGRVLSPLMEEVLRIEAERAALAQKQPQESQANECTEMGKPGNRDEWLAWKADLDSRQIEAPSLKPPLPKATAAPQESPQPKREGLIPDVE